jgi:hypothetical protein
VARMRGQAQPRTIFVAAPSATNQESGTLAQMSGGHRGEVVDAGPAVTSRPGTLRRASGHVRSWVSR